MEKKIPPSLEYLCLEKNYEWRPTEEECRALKEELDCVGLWSDSRDKKCRQATGISLSNFSMARAIQRAIPSQYPSLIGGGFATEMCGRTKLGKHGDIDIFVFFFKMFNLRGLQGIRENVRKLERSS